MKRLFAIILYLALAACLCGCGRKNTASAGQSGGSAAAPSAEQRKVSSVEVYNRTGKIQKEEFPDYVVEYTYDDSGRLLSVKKNGGELGSNAPIETYLYSGGNCTQKVLYNAFGSTQEASYWTYGKDGVLTKERVVSIAADVSGKPAKTESVTDYEPDGTKKVTVTSDGSGFTKTEYGYGPAGKLVTENIYHSTDGKTYDFAEAHSYAYDEVGNLVRFQKRDSADVIFSSELFEVDETGNILKDTVYSAAEPTEQNMLSQHLYEYGENGKVSFEALYAGENLTQTYYAYDDAGNRTRVSVQTYRSGKLTGTETTETEYDSHSNPVRETVTGEDGHSTVTAQWEYEYYEDGRIKRKTNYES